MSAATATARPTSPAPTTWEGERRAVRPRSGVRESSPSQRQLHVVRGIAPGRSTIPFVLLIAAILVGALATTMVLNAKMAATAYDLQKASAELDVVQDHVETVRGQVNAAAAPDALAKRAAELGMVPAAAPGVVDLRGGTVTGGSAAGAPGASGAGGADGAASAPSAGSTGASGQ
ncbi:hypothetical protein [Actinomyces gaoshouyii]|uniref:Cell division protein FtsL n=1 Tax=Actinomyces gaoshouyii TaxID=1960083 RepID=A0A8H9LJC6_9ACTO|nr:hypothetical protein [Actinomyces gaoshouyii]ARD41894.1 hypothetical protein B6G06_05700 [Actinomyces gaoshouyii]GGO99911.1 hypothetical protein GCM10011612_18300 [Actinomyces gaoshouyii]